MLKDQHGQTVSGATPEALALYERAVAQFNCYSGNPLETAEAAIAAAPRFAMAHLLRAHLMLSGMEAAGLGPAHESLAAARDCAAPGSTISGREIGHVAAAEAWLQGRFESASLLFDRILLDHPNDLVALQMGHLLDFYRGDARNLRDRVLRVMPAWDAKRPGHHALLGMLGFGLNECGDYARAETAGRDACELEPRDAWAHHAVAHVMEMQNRVEDGIRWARVREPYWAADNMMCVHNWWHMVLMHLERDEHAEVLKLYDDVIRGSRSAVVLDMIDASAMLWRLNLRGIDAGAARWAEIAEAWAPLSTDGIYAFNDVHALMSFLGANRRDLVEQQIDTLRRAAGSGTGIGLGGNAAMAAQVGLPVAQALVAFADQRYSDCIALLQPVRTIAHRFGGSHAQRDLLDLTLLEAAKRAGDQALLRGLSAERLHVRPKSPLALRYRAAANERLAA